jgi:hypothetical protein
VANGHGGARRNSGRPYAAPRAAALRILEAAIAYCAGVAGDPRQDLAPEATWARYLRQVGEAGRATAATDLQSAVATSFAMLDRAVSVRISEDAGDGLSALLRALDHGATVPDASILEHGSADQDQGATGTPGLGAPEQLSGALPAAGPQLALEGLMVPAVGVPSGREGPRQVRDAMAPLPPPGSPPMGFVVHPENLEFLQGREGPAA